MEIKNIFLLSMLVLMSCTPFSKEKAEASKENTILSNSQDRTFMNTSKIKLPANLKFGMSVEEVLKINPCDLQKLITPKKSNVISLMCKHLAPTIIIKQANEFLKPIFVAELWFVDNKLRSIVTRLTENPNDYFMIIVTEVKRILGLPQIGFSDDDARKFNSGVKNQLFVAWEDGNQGVIVNITSYPDGGKAASLNIFPSGFNFAEEIGE